MITKPLLIRVQAGSRDWGLDIEISDKDFVLIYENNPTNGNTIYTNQHLTLDMLPTRFLSSRIWSIADLYAKYEAHDDAVFLWENIRKIRERIAIASPHILREDMVRVVNLYRNLWDGTSNFKYLMYIKFWSDAIRDIGILGVDAILHRSNAEEYKEIRKGVPQHTAENIVQDAISIIDIEHEWFLQDPDTEIFYDIQKIIGSYKDTQMH